MADGHDIVPYADAHETRKKAIERREERVAANSRTVAAKLTREAVASTLENMVLVEYIFSAGGPTEVDCGLVFQHMRTAGYHVGNKSGKGFCRFLFNFVDPPSAVSDK